MYAQSAKTWPTVANVLWSMVTNMSYAKMAEIERPFGGMDYGGPKNPLLRQFWEPVSALHP